MNTHSWAVIDAHQVEKHLGSIKQDERAKG